MEYLSSYLGTALPELIVLCMAMLILLVDLWISPSRRFIVYGLTQITLICAAFFTFTTHKSDVSYALNGMFVDDTLADVLKLMAYLGLAVIFVYTRRYQQNRQLYRGEYYALVLLSLLGMMVMISGYNLLVIYMGLELLSLCMYALVAFDRDNLHASEAAMKYFVLGALASGMLLYGMSMIYGMVGTLDIGKIALALTDSHTQSPVMMLGLVFVVAGLAFKFGAAPFQMWVPDVYQGAPTSVTILIGSVPKLAAFAITLRLLVQGLNTLVLSWQDMMLFMAVLSIVIGNFSAIVQSNLKRMLAYSGISHIGFLLFGIMSANLNGLVSSMFYVSSYVLMTIAAFGIILLLSRKGFEAAEINDLKGLNQKSPWMAFLMLIVMFSMAGIPPTVGFYAKLLVLQAAWQAGFTWAVVLAVLMAVIGAFYYLNIVRKMYFDDANDLSAIEAPYDMRAMLSINAIALLILGVFPQALIAICLGSMVASISG